MCVCVCVGVCGGGGGGLEEGDGEGTAFIIRYKITCAPCDGSDQTVHPRSLIRVFAGHPVDCQ